MDNLQNLPATIYVGKAGLVAGTTNTYSTTIAAGFYAIRGKAYTKAAVTAGAVPVVDVVDGLAFATQAIGTGSVYVFGYDAAGTLRVAQGDVQALDVSGNFLTAPQFPIIPDTVCPFGYLIVKAAPATAAVPAVATWTFGTNNFSAVTGVSFAFQDLMTLPDRPQVQ
jgi:hypothetical protein